MTSEFMPPDRWEQIQELYHAALELEFFLLNKQHRENQ
jgi:hypothetical protein